MKYRVFCFISVFVLMLFCCNFPMATAQAQTEPVETTAYARFENMLNHNRLFGEDFSDTNTVVENSIISLLSKREEDFIKEDIVSCFVYNMYSLDIEDYKANTNAPVREGYIFILPRGYDDFSHEIVSVTKSGTLYCVISEVTFNTHDGVQEKATCETVFLENEDSAFGYNIISANLLS